MKFNFRHEINGIPVITAVVQDYKTDQVLMLAHMNEEALKKTVETKKAHYWSTSRNRIWLKGETSSHTQEVCEILFDCDLDAVVLKVRQKGVACHEGYMSCFYRKLDLNKSVDVENLDTDDFEIILKRGD